MSLLLASLVATIVAIAGVLLLALIFYIFANRWGFAGMLVALFIILWILFAISLGGSGPWEGLL